jgi:hypothetical protein
MIRSDKAGEPTVLEGGAMLKKFLMAAGLAAAFSLSAQVAEAKVKVIIGIGQPGGYCYYNYDPFRCGGYGYYPRPGYFVPHPIIRDRVSCREATWMLRDRGFHSIYATDCGGSSYSFIARKHGDKFKIKVNSYNGRILSVRPI